MKAAIFEFLYAITVFYIPVRLVQNWLSKKISPPDRNKEFYLVIAGAAVGSGIIISWISGSVHTGLSEVSRSGGFSELIQFTGIYIALFLTAVFLNQVIAGFVFHSVTKEKLVDAVKNSDTGKVIFWLGLLWSCGLISGGFVNKIAEYIIPYPVAPFPV